MSVSPESGRLMYPPWCIAPLLQGIHHGISRLNHSLLHAQFYKKRSLECLNVLPRTHSLGGTMQNTHSYKLKLHAWKSHQYPWLLRSAKTAPDSQPIIVPWITPATGPLPLPSTTTSPFILHLANISVYNNLSSVSSTTNTNQIIQSNVKIVMWTKLRLNIIIHCKHYQ